MAADLPARDEDPPRALDHRGHDFNHSLSPLGRGQGEGLAHEAVHPPSTASVEPVT